MVEPVPILTVGDLKSELSRWSDDAPVNFYLRSRNRNSDFTATGPVRTPWCLRSTSFPKLRQRCWPAPNPFDGPPAVHAGRPPGGFRLQLTSTM